MGRPTHCQVCQKQQPLLRCQKCQSAWYCSVSCQRLDWKAQHRRWCGSRRSSNNSSSHTQVAAAAAAWKELSHILSTASLDQVQQDYHAATDKLKSLSKEAESNIKVGVTPSVTEQLKPSRSPKTEEAEITHLDESNRNLIKEKGKSIPKDYVGNNSSERDWNNSTMDNHNSNDAPFWNFHVEDMPQLQCYQILLRPVDDTRHRQQIILDLDGLKLSFTSSRSTCQTLLSVAYFRQPALRLELPRRLWAASGAAETTKSPQPPPIKSPRVYLVEDARAVSIRLTYHDNTIQSLSMDEDERRSDGIIMPFAPLKLLAPDMASQSLACGYCHQLLLKKCTDDDAVAIDRVLPLPSGRWDEMQDYLICYEGQATFDFSATSTCGQRKTLLDDATVLVAHRHNVGEVVCVLALTGYGEDCRTDKYSNNIPLSTDLGLSDKDPTALARGSRPWREAVGGAALTCSVCASSLGFAPVELKDTFRFLKHRLVLLKNGDSSTAATPLQTISSFVAHEMIRYAETKAIFTFVVNIDSDSVGRFLFMRLVGWDSCAASSFEAERGKDDVYRIPHWRRRSKILYEECASGAGLVESELWMWTGTHLGCCPPPSNGSNMENKKSEPATGSPDEQSVSVIRLCLSTQERKQLVTQLHYASNFYAKEVIEATIVTKLGRSVRPHDRIGLASIPL